MLLRKWCWIILLTTSFSVCAEEIQLPIIAYWNFDDDTEKELVDSGPNKLNAILTTKDTTCKMLKTKGMRNSALLWKKDRPVKYIIQDKQKILNIKPPYTICVWIRLDDKTNKLMSILSCKFDTAKNGYSFNTGWRSICYYWGDSEKTERIRSPQQDFLKKGIWFHAALVNDGSKITIFIDGNPVFEQKYVNAAPAPTKSTTVIGSYPGKTSGYNFVGAIDELYIIGKALNKDEIYVLASNMD
ncbi:MAG: hypothetical protein A2017_21865 [Lentisphaerae bacterium GWF2_44_16]|nr:MAG: hypothetical protein A2017_21865 [Lentisphaerae bacterium GWF2_44_16]